MNKSKGFVIIVAVIVLVVASGIGLYLYSGKTIDIGGVRSTQEQTKDTKTAPLVPESAKADNTLIPDFKSHNDVQGNFSLQYPGNWKSSAEKGRLKLEYIVKEETGGGSLTLFSFWTIALDTYGLPQSNISKVQTDIESKSNIVISGTQSQQKITRDTATSYESSIDFVWKGKMGNITEKWYVGGDADNVARYSNRAEVLRQFEQIRSSIHLAK